MRFVSIGVSPPLGKYYHEKLGNVNIFSKKV